MPKYTIQFVFHGEKYLANYEARNAHKAIEYFCAARNGWRAKSAIRAVYENDKRLPQREWK